MNILHRERRQANHVGHSDFQAGNSYMSFGKVNQKLPKKRQNMGQQNQSGLGPTKHLAARKCDKSDTADTAGYSQSILKLKTTVIHSL